MPGFWRNQMAALCSKTSKPLGRGRSEQTEQEQCCQLPLLPLSMTEEPAENKWPGTSGSEPLYPKDDHSLPVHPPHHQHHTPSSISPCPPSWDDHVPSLMVFLGCKSVTILSYRPWCMILGDHTVPQETDPRSMLNKPKVLSFYNQELYESHIVTESNSTVLCNGVCFLWGK